MHRYTVMWKYLSQDGKILRDDKPLIHADNRGFRYGDGLFETLKVIDGKIQLADLHFERMLNTMRLMFFDMPSYYTADYFKEQIVELCAKNNHLQLARVRVVVHTVEMEDCMMPKIISLISLSKPGHCPIPPILLMKMDL